MEIKVGWSRLTVLWNIFRSHRSAWFPMLTARRFSEFDTSVICHAVLALCSGSFLLVRSSCKTCFKAQRLKYPVEIMLPLILY